MYHFFSWIPVRFWLATQFLLIFQIEKSKKQWGFIFQMNWFYFFSYKNLRIGLNFLKHHGDETILVKMHKHTRVTFKGTIFTKIISCMELKHNSKLDYYRRWKKYNFNRKTWNSTFLAVLLVQGCLYKYSRTHIKLPTLIKRQVFYEKATTDISPTAKVATDYKIQKHFYYDCF